jgi:Lon protease-like protein
MTDFPDISILEYASQSMPLFPLGRTVLLPHTVLPLHVFEPRYVQLVRHIQNSHHLFAIPRLKDISLCTKEELQKEQPPIHRIAGIAKIMQVQELPKNRFNIWTLGVGTMYIEEELPINSLPIDHENSFLYRRAQGRICLPSYEGDLQSNLSTQEITNNNPTLVLSPQEGKEQLLLTKHLLLQVSQQCPQMSEEVSKLLEPSVADDCVLNIIAHFFIKSTSQKQQFLEEMNLGKRAQLLNNIIADIVINCNEES